MFNNFNVSEKFFIKTSIDFSLIFASFLIFVILKLANTSTTLTLLILAVSLLIVILLELIINIRFGTVLKSSFAENNSKRLKTKACINEILNRQKQTINNYLQTTKEFQENSTAKENPENLNILKQRIQIVSDLILELSQYNRQISSNIEIIENITEQTNMLALNATVESARAGEHGKGFAVVASEIRKLADESKNATNKILTLINDVQNVTNSTIMATEEGSKEIDSIIKNSDMAGLNFNEITNILNSILKNISEITQSFNSEQTQD